VTTTPLFPSFFVGGFECSTHLRHSDRKRLDLARSTKHERFVREDYERLHEVGISTARDGVPWYRVDSGGAAYDWSDVVPMIRAARETKTLVLWDLLHFGYPGDLDFFSAEFVERFRLYARAFAKLYREETDAPLFVAPVNEISFVSWGGGDAGFFNPFAKKRGDDVKTQLVRATIAATQEIRDVVPSARMVQPEPVIDIIAHPTRPQDRRMAENYRQAQFQAFDMIAGRQRPELGGREEYLDVVGMNYYIQNQWIHEGSVLVPSHPLHLPLRFMMREVWERYRRPLFIAETGIEGDVRPNWLRYIGREVRGALRLGVPVEGVCLYPIVDHPGWEDDRYCPNGLWGYADDEGRRPIFLPLAAELARQRRLFAGEEVLPDDERATPGSPAALAAERRDLDLLDVAAVDLDRETTKSREG
jgi:hypothetical protein